MLVVVRDVFLMDIFLLVLSIEIACPPTITWMQLYCYYSANPIIVKMSPPVTTDCHHWKMQSCWTHLFYLFWIVAVVGEKPVDKQPAEIAAAVPAASNCCQIIFWSFHTSTNLLSSRCFTSGFSALLLMHFLNSKIEGLPNIINVVYHDLILDFWNLMQQL